MTWHPEFEISDLPSTIATLFSDHADLMYGEMQKYRNEIALIPAPRPQHQDHKIRIVANQNPQWYRELYWARSNFRRDLTVRALDRIRKKEDKPFDGVKYVYDTIYRELIKNRLADGYKDTGTGYDFPGENVVREYFGLEPMASNWDFSYGTIGDEIPF